MRARRRLVFAVLATTTSVALVLAACGLDVTGSATGGGATDAGDARGEASLPPKGDASVDGPGPSDAASDADADGCPTSLPGPVMVLAADFCVDSTEVTNAQYAEFLDASADGGVLLGPDAGRPAWCKPDASVAPAYPLGGANGPVQYINWCDAFAYCRWAGKHLCTGLDAGEWARACTRDGTRKLPYGNTIEAGACNVNPPGGSEKDAGSFPACEGGYDGLFDMVGNLEEWVDDCDPDGGKCRVLGGAWYTQEGNATCGTAASYAPLPKNSGTYGIGFRCCK